MFRAFQAGDLAEYLKLSRDFYASSATDHPVDEEHFHRTFNECLRPGGLSRGWLIEDEAGAKLGYMLASLTWSNELGGRVAWLEELWLKEEARGSGLGRRVMEGVMEELKLHEDVRGFRLEVAPANESVSQLYARLGFSPVPYRAWWLELK